MKYTGKNKLNLNTSAELTDWLLFVLSDVSVAGVYRSGVTSSHNKGHVL